MIIFASSFEGKNATCCHRLVVQDVRLSRGKSPVQIRLAAPIHLPVAQLDEQRATNAKACRFESCREGQLTACRGVWSSLPALEAGDRVFKSHHADHLIDRAFAQRPSSRGCSRLESRGSSKCDPIHTKSAPARWLSRLDLIRMPALSGKARSLCRHGARFATRPARSTWPGSPRRHRQRSP